MDDLTILYTTWPDAETAQATGRAAVETRLAACANILAPMTSIYSWGGEVQTETEVPMLLKTPAETAEALKAFILARHPYDTPCVLALQTGAPGSHAAFVAWARAAVGGGR